MKVGSRFITSIFTILEFGIIFILVPLVIAFRWLPVGLILLPLYLLVMYTLWWLFLHKRYHWNSLWRGSTRLAEEKQLKLILVRFLVMAIALIVLTGYFFPGKLFNLPQNHPLLWVLIIILYPAISVLPQEMLYRTFFFERYRRLFPTRQWLVIASSVAFGFMHIVFQNYLAVVITFVGGYFFAQSYAATRSLRLVCLEHSLYGQLIFTVGLGEFFLYEHSLKIQL